MLELNGKVVVVTGAAEGLGRDIAVTMAKSGAKVVLADIKECKTTLELIHSYDGEGRFVRCDVSNKLDVDALMTEANNAYGGIDILVNNAGVMGFSSVEEGDTELLDRVYETNVKGTFLCCSSAIPYLRSSPSAAIVNLSSTMVFQGVPGASAYAASKGAIVGFSRTLARELKQDGIRVNVVTPGFIPTPGVNNLGLPPDFSEPLLSQQCINRLGSGEDIAKAVVFMASAGSSFISGQILNIDGGLVTM